MRRLLLLTVLLAASWHGEHEALEHLEHLHHGAKARRCVTRKAVR